MDKAFVEKYINEKLSKGENFITVSFFELRVKNNLSESATNDFLNMAKAHLEKAGYQVFLSGEYVYKGLTKQVQSNELLVAIKDDSRF